jgi:hypothetical protein
VRCIILCLGGLLFHVLVFMVLYCGGDYSCPIIINFQIVQCVNLCLAGYCSLHSCLLGRVVSSTWMGITQDQLSFSSHRRGLPDCGFTTSEFMCGK